MNSQFEASINLKEGRRKKEKRKKKEKKNDFMSNQKRLKEAQNLSEATCTSQVSARTVKSRWELDRAGPSWRTWHDRVNNVTDK